jgi:hypothetical protein
MSNIIHKGIIYNILMVSGLMPGGSALQLHHGC